MSQKRPSMLAMPFANKAAIQLNSVLSTIDGKLSKNLTCALLNKDPSNLNKTLKGIQTKLSARKNPDTLATHALNLVNEAISEANNQATNTQAQSMKLDATRKRRSSMQNP
jgi:hypothetical protein